MSSRRGIVAMPRPSISSTNRSNRYSASLGPGPASGWYWTVAPGTSSSAQPLDGAVVEVDVGQLGGAEVGLPADRLVALDRRRAVGAEHGEAVVLAGDLGPAGGQVLDRVVGAVVAERQLVGLKPDRAAQQLVAEADPVHRELADELRGRSRRCSRARPGRPGRWRGTPHRARWRAAAPRSRCRGAARRSRPRRGGCATIERLTPVSIIAIRGPGPARRRSSDKRSAAGVTSRARSRPVIGGSAAISSRASVLGDVAPGTAPPRIAPGVADVAHERARVEVGDRGNACVGQPSSASPAPRPGRRRGRLRRA